MLYKQKDATMENTSLVIQIAASLVVIAGAIIIPFAAIYFAKLAEKKD